MTDEEIRKSKERLYSLIESREDLAHARARLLENPIVQEYVAADSLFQETDADIIKLRQEIIEAEQENCQHPAWVLLYKDSDPYEGRVYYECRCVACGKQVYDIARGFPNDRVIFDAPSVYMNKEWDEFSENCSDEYFSVEEKGRAFTKKFNSNKKH